MTTNNTSEETPTSNDIQFEKVPVVSSSFTSQRGVSFPLDAGIPKTSVYNITLQLPEGLSNDVTILNAQLWKTADNTYQHTKRSWSPRSDGATVDHDSGTATLKKIRFLEASYTAQHCLFCIVLFDQTKNPPQPVCRTELFKVLARKPQKHSPAANDKLQNTPRSKASRIGAHSNGNASSSSPLSTGSMMSLLSSPDSTQLAALSGTNGGGVSTTNGVVDNTNNNTGESVRKPQPKHPSDKDRPPTIRPMPSDNNAQFTHHENSKFTQVSSLAT